jgi:SAM-dependent methyltransferase
MARDRPLEKVNRLLGVSLEDLVGDPILEIGFGFGRVLLELALKFPDLNFFGIDATSTGPVLSSEDLAWTHAEYDLAGELPTRLPDLGFYTLSPRPDTPGVAKGVGRIRFPDETFQLIYSAVAIRFVADKAWLLEEVCRVLKVGGRAILHFDSQGWENQEFTRFVIRDGPTAIPVFEYLQSRAAGFELRLSNSDHCVLEITREREGELNLGLEFDYQHSLEKDEMPVTADGQSIGGRRSAYRVRPVSARS